MPKKPKQPQPWNVPIPAAPPTADDVLRRNYPVKVFNRKECKTVELDLTRRGLLTPEDRRKANATFHEQRPRLGIESILT